MGNLDQELLAEDGLQQSIAPNSKIIRRRRRDVWSRVQQPMAPTQNVADRLTGVATDRPWADTLRLSQNGYGNINI